MTIEGDWKIMTEAATKNVAVKKEIKQLAIQSWEQANVNKYGPIMANNIANHLRQVNKTSVDTESSSNLGSAL